MAKVFTTVKGSVMEIGHYGTATNDSPAVVPQAVADELAGRQDLRIEPDEAPKPSRPSRPAAAAPPAEEKKE